MNQDRYRLANSGLLIVLSLSALLGMVGCAHIPAQITPVSNLNLNVAALSTEDIVQVMLQAGFSDKQIVEFGTDLRNELARSGAAQINVGGKVEAIFAIHGDYLYVSSYLKGSFIYDLTKESVVNNHYTFVPITVKAVNDKTKANDDSATTQEDRSVPITLTITLTGNDPDGDPLTYSVVTGPSHGKLSGTAPNLTYTPNANFNGSDSFTFKVNDGTVDGVSATVSITVTPVNDPPVANDDDATMQEDTQVSIALMGNDPDGDPLTYSVVTAPSHGKLSGTAPNLTYTPNANFNGSDNFTFKVNDGTVDSVSATVSITVTPVNDPPVANDDDVTMQEDTQVSIALMGNDPDGDPLTYSVVTAPSHGKMSGTAPNLAYTPNANFNGSDSFTFKVNDGTVDSVSATVSITVTTVNDPPVATDNDATMQEDTQVSIALMGNDPDEDLLTYSVVTGPSHGKLSGTTPNLTYTPNANFNGSDNFTFNVNDGMVDSVSATVSITVTPVNDTPVATDDDATMQEDTQVSIALMGNDPDEDPLTYSVVTGPSHGKLSGKTPNLTYTPNANFNGLDNFTFNVNDGTVDSDSATVSITVTPVNDTPVATDEDATMQEDTQVSITLMGNDPDEDLLTYSVVTAPSHGKLSGTTPNLTYTPNANLNGSDSFTFNVNDGTVDSVSATVSITVTPVNDPPVANDDSAKTLEDIPIVKIDVLANDTDVDNDRLAVTAVTQGTSGSVTINSDGTLTYTTYAPSANFYGTDAFTYTVWDGKSGTDTGTVHVAINAINDKPVIRSTAVNTVTVGELYAYDVDAKDIEGDTLTYSLTTKPAGMTIDPATGLIEWTPTNANLGTNDVVVKVTDSYSAPASDTQLFTITVKAISSPQTLFIVDGYDQRGKKTLSAAGTGKTNVVQASDNDRWETKFGSYISYDFSDVPIPPGATITSVAVYVEHFEQERFTSGKLQWSVGTGWPSNPVVWMSISAPVHEGEQNEAIDLWDATSFVDTPKKINDLQLQVKNNDNIARRKSLVDDIYVVVEWNYTAADEKKRL